MGGKSASFPDKRDSPDGDDDGNGNGNGNGNCEFSLLRRMCWRVKLSHLRSHQARDMCIHGLGNHKRRTSIEFHSPISPTNPQYIFSRCGIVSSREGTYPERKTCPERKTFHSENLQSLRPLIPVIRAHLPRRKVVFDITEHGIPFLWRIALIHYEVTA